MPLSEHARVCLFAIGQRGTRESISRCGCEQKSSNRGRLGSKKVHQQGKQGEKGREWEIDKGSF